MCGGFYGLPKYRLYHAEQRHIHKTVIQKQYIGVDNIGHVHLL